VVRDYEFWTRPPHLAGDTGLSRYFDFGEGPAPEILIDPSNYYRSAAEYFLLHEGATSPQLALARDASSPRQSDKLAFPVYVCDPETDTVDSRKCSPAERVALTSDFYKGDRSMRESGFDMTFRFGPFGADTHHYAPVCLNSLLYKTETDLEQMATMLAMNDAAQQWGAKADERRERITKLLWNAGRGLYFDYDFVAGKPSSYEYATTFYPLWAGLASAEQARAVEQNLGLFEQPGGISMSRRDTGAQWDFPYGWAPIQLLAVEGLRRYSDPDDANRIAYKFLSTVLQNFLRDGTIREKYDVAAKSSDTHVAKGYQQNVVGFGWTNGVFLELLHDLPPEYVARFKRMPPSGNTLNVPVGVLPNPNGHARPRTGRAPESEPGL
jgi:alpha,alpha-trehalase